MIEKPALRPLDFQPVHHQGQPMWLLRDPLQLTNYQLVFPPALAQMLLLIDGTRSPAEIHSAFCRQTGAELPEDLVHTTLSQLNEARLLDNADAHQAKADLLVAYRRQPYRPPALADLSYPADPDELTALFDSYSHGDDTLTDWQPWRGRALVSPHIDYQRGGPVYAKVWRRAETAVAEADIVLIFGTDHNGGHGAVTLTRVPYATPYGVLPTDTDLVDAVANAITPTAAYAEELHHRQEHAVELSAVWLHYIYQRLGLDPKPMIPILVGSFHHFVNVGGHPAKDDRLNAALAALRQATAGKNVLAVASVDLAHVGPQFGDGFHMDSVRRDQLRRSDDSLVQAVLQGDAAGFYNQIAAVQDRDRICGFSPIYLMLRYLGEQASGLKVAYNHCPADAQNHSLVSICGLLLE